MGVKSWAIIPLILVYSASGFPPEDHSATTKCLPTDKLCKFILIIEERLTMTCLGTSHCLVIPHVGNLYDSRDTDFLKPITEGIAQADGYYQNPRVVIVVNGTFPGPPIEVYQGQRVRITVVNHLHSEATMIHWHGVHQRGSPHMDGAAFLSQCPILPGQSFEYEFDTLNQVGTFWYHSHNGAQRTEGLYGAFIIHPKENATKYDEKIMLLQDWNHDHDSNAGYLKAVYGYYKDGEKFNFTSSIDGSLFIPFRWHSGLVNGKGRFWHNSTDHNKAPLQVYDVTQNTTVLFRVIAAGNLYPLRVSIDDHPLTVVASDGDNFEPIVVESFIISPGERFDFKITTDQPIDNYWIRAVSLEEGGEHFAEAVLHYEGASNSTDYDSAVTTNRQDCNQTECLVLNCPFQEYKSGSGQKCVHLHELNGTVGSVPTKDLEEIFLNFGFHGFSGTVNGKVWKAPTVSAVTQGDELEEDCEKEECGIDKVCTCTNIVKLQYGKNYQLVFTNVGVNHNINHPIHLHGHSFYVLKQGFSYMNRTLGKNENISDDIRCEGNQTLNLCNSVKWSNSSWSTNLPDAAARPVLKDTVMVPNGGYAVVRFTADNPGVWFLHCHAELHMLMGMAMAFNEAPEKQIHPIGKFPTCRSYLPHQQVSQLEETTYRTTTSGVLSEGSRSPSDAGGSHVALAGLLQVLVLMHLCVLV